MKNTFKLRQFQGIAKQALAQNVQTKALQSVAMIAFMGLIGCSGGSNTQSAVGFPYRILPVAYTLSQSKDGWRYGTVGLAFENISGKNVETNFTLSCGKPYVTTKEGPNYPVEIHMREGLPSELFNPIHEDREYQVASSVHSVESLTILLNGGLIPPGYRFRGIGDTQIAKEYVARWRSAEAATPDKLKFQDCPSIDILLPADRTERLKFPFDEAPLNIESLSSLRGVTVGYQSKATAMFTGICYRRNSQEIAEGPYFLEVDVANADQFDESNIYLPIYISTLYPDGQHATLVPATMELYSMVRGDFSKTPLPEWKLGPAQHKRVYILAGTRTPFNGDNANIVVSIRSESGQWKHFHTHDCRPSY